MSAEGNKTVSAAGWKKARTHNVLLPSGVRVDIEIPDLPKLISTGEFPQHLLDAALGLLSKAEDAKLSREDIVQQSEFTDAVVLATVVSPKITQEDLDLIPFEDKQMITELATRQRDLDAEGEHIAGLTKSEKFRRFRGLSGFGPDVEDV